MFQIPEERKSGAGRVLGTFWESDLLGITQSVVITDLKSEWRSPTPSPVLLPFHPCHGHSHLASLS